MKRRKFANLKSLGLAVGLLLGRGAQADTVLNFGALPAGQASNSNGQILQTFGDNASASSAGVAVTGSGTPNIGLTWSSSPNVWDYYIGGVWSAVQLNESQIGNTHSLTFTPGTGAAAVIKSFNFHGYYNSTERFTYNWDVLSGAITNASGSYSFLSDGTKNHAVNINYTGTANEELTLRLTRIASTLGGGEVEGDKGDIAVDDITFDEVAPPIPHTTLTFGSLPVGQPSNGNIQILQTFGDNASASSAGVSVTGSGTPNIGLTWASSPNVWDYYIGGVWTAVQLNESQIGNTHDLTFTPINGVAAKINSFNFHGYYNSTERFTYNWEVLSGVTSRTNGTYSFLSDGTKNHAVSINYTGYDSEELTLRLTRVASTLGGGEVEGDKGDIAVDDIDFAEADGDPAPPPPGSNSHAYQDYVISQGPLVYYRLDDTNAVSLTAANSGSLGATGNGTHTVLNPGSGALAGNDDTSVRFGESGQAPTAGGRPILIPNNAGLNTSVFTVEAWVKPTLQGLANAGSPLANRVSDDGASGRQGWVFFQRAAIGQTPPDGNGSGFNFRMYKAGTTSTAINITGGAYAVGTWNHLAATYDGTTARLYLNGAEVASAVVSGVYAPNTLQSLGIGAWPELDGGGPLTQNPYTGFVDEVALYGSALDASQIASHYANGTNASRATPYETLVATDGAAGYYRLNEGLRAVNSGTLAAAADGKINSTALNGVGPGPAAFDGIESTNSARSFNGTNSYVGLGNPTGLNISGQITLQAWIKPAATQSSYTANIIAHGGNLADNAEVVLRLTDANDTNLRRYEIGSWDGVAAHNVTFTIPASDIGGANWVHLAGTYDGANWKLYRNGTNVATAANGTGAVVVNDADWAIGMHGGGTARYFNGSIDEAAIFDRALTAGEILSQYYAATTTNTPPIILTQPQSQTLVTNQTISLTADAAGTPALTYQWRQNGSPIIGATDATYNKAVAVTNDSGSYEVVVSNAFGAATSDAVNVIVVGSPVITIQPASTNVNQGANATLSVTATGGSLAYQWKYGGVDISGATDSSYTVVNVQADDDDFAYSVTITNLAGSTNSDGATLTFTADAVLPTVTITTPKANKGTNQAIINVTGIAKDPAPGSRIISAVKYVFGGVTNSATINQTAVGTYSFASASPITLSPGTNTIDIWAEDLAGNVSLHTPYNFYYDTSNSVHLFINGSGQVKFGPTTWSAPSNNIGIFKVGRSYKIDAFIGKGTNTVFTNWSGDVSSVMTNWTQKSSLVFNVISNMTINANFITNPYTAVAGIYNGLFSETGGVTHASAGFFSVKVKDKSQYSGYVLLDGDKVSFSGKFTASGNVTRSVDRTKVGKSPLTLSMALDNFPAGEGILGTIGNGVWTSDIISDKAGFDEKALPPVLDSTNFIGTYTMQIPAAAGAPTNTPGGSGYGTLTNNAAGYVKLAGKMADGGKQTISQKVNVSRTGNYPLYVPLYQSSTIITNEPYTPASGTPVPKYFLGSVMGWVQFTSNGQATPTNAPTGDVTWIKTGYNPGQYVLKDLTNNVLYPSGFSNAVSLVGSAYVEPGANSLPIDILTGKIIVSEGNLLVDAMTNAITVLTNKVVTTVSADKFTLSFKKKDGSFKGNFLRPGDLVKTDFYGALLQNTTNATGAFLGTTNSGTVTVTSP